MLIEKNNCMVCIERTSGEAKEHYIKRLFFVASQNPTTEKEYITAVKYSKIYINTQYLECKYNVDVMERLEKMIKKYHSD